MTFWGDNVFIGKNGKSVPNGITLRKEVLRQVDPKESKKLMNLAGSFGYVTLSSTVLMLLLALYIDADTYPIWSMINLITIIVRFPMQNLQLPGGTNLFIREF